MKLFPVTVIMPSGPSLPCRVQAATPEEARRLIQLAAGLRLELHILAEGVRRGWQTPPSQLDRCERLLRMIELGPASPEEWCEYASVLRPEETT